MLSIKTERMQTIVNLISGIIAMLANAIINFCLAPFIVRTMGEEANGFTQLANNFVSYASMITLAFNSMAGRFISVSYHQKKFEKVKTYYSSLVMNNVLIDTILVPVSIFVIWNLEKIIVIQNVDIEDVKILFACVFINFFLNQFVSVYNVSMFVTNSLYYQNILNLLRYILNGVLLLIVFSIFPAKLYYISLIVVGLTLCILLIVQNIKVKIMPELKFDLRYFKLETVKEMLTSGIWNTVNQCGNMLLTGVDLLMCNLYISPNAMGILSVVKIIPNAIISLSTLLNNNFAPALTIDYAKGNRSGLLSQLRSNMKISSIILTIPIITFCSYGMPFYSLWMPSMDAKQLSVLSFLTCMVFIPWSGLQTLYTVFTATNRLKVNSIAFVSSGILNVGIVYACLKYTNWGIYAVAGTSSVLSIIRNLIITAPYTAKLLGLKWYSFYKDVGISVICCFINFCVAFVVKEICCVENWASLIASVLITCVITLILDMLFVLSRREREQVLALMRKKVNK